jgi:hypothetical protein
MGRCALMKGISNFSVRAMPVLPASGVRRRSWPRPTLAEALIGAQSRPRGWSSGVCRLESDKKGRAKDRGWTCDLIPKPLIVARYFAKEQVTIEAQQAEVEAAAVSLAPGTLSKHVPSPAPAAGAISQGRRWARCWPQRWRPSRSV